ASVPGARTVSDLTGQPKTPEQVQNFDPNKPAIPTQVNIQPIGSDIRPGSLQKAPVPAEVPPTVPEPQASQSTPSEIHPIDIPASVQAGNIVKGPWEAGLAAAKTSETAPQRPVSTEIPQKAPNNAENQPISPNPDAPLDTNGNPTPVAQTPP